MEVLEDFESNLCSKTEVIGKVWGGKKNHHGRQENEGVSK